MVEWEALKEEAPAGEIPPGLLVYAVRRTVSAIMFCGLSHEEEGQGVTGEVEEAFPVPGGIGLGVRDEGRGREVRREDGAEPVYVPQELGVPALHTSGGVEGGEHGITPARR